MKYIVRCVIKFFMRKNYFIIKLGSSEVKKKSHKNASVEILLSQLVMECIFFVV